MTTRRCFLAGAAVPALLTPRLRAAAAGLDPKGKIHIPIGIPNTLDTLKTFVEREGNFSPGLGTYGVYYWLWDTESRTLYAPTQAASEVLYGLAPPGLLIPWTSWRGGKIQVTTELCQVERSSPAGRVYVVAARARLKNTADRPQSVALYVALRPLGAAGGDVPEIAADRNAGALLVNGHPAIVAARRPSAIGVLDTDEIGDRVAAGSGLGGGRTTSATGDCSGAMRFNLTLRPGQEDTVAILCPVLAGRRAARHQWVDRGQNAMVDAAELNPSDGGIPQPDPGTGYYRSLNTANLFAEARAYWQEIAGRIDLSMPDSRWAESMQAILGHAAMCMNENAPDVAVVNYGVFNRDGMYIANIMQKAGLARESEQIVDYFVHHPFNGRAYPEADNPGQILWAMEQHWLLTHDRSWLDRICPAVRSIAALIRYCRTTPGPHWVDMNGLESGDAVAERDRRELVPGKCDGLHPEYTEAFDIAGLRGAARLAEAGGNPSEAVQWRELAESLFASYDRRFGSRLPDRYGSYSVLWPCRLYPLERGKAYEQFRGMGVQQPKSWRYFPLATAHQGLLAHNREAGFGTIGLHLAQEQMRGWYAFDEGGGSGSGAWYRTRTNWTHSKEKPGENRSVAMPHGWAIAEFWLLMRDCIAFEDSDQLVLLAGIPPGWFLAPEGMRAKRLPTYFGGLDLDYRPEPGGARLEIGGASPAGGFVLRLPSEMSAAVTLGNSEVPVDASGDCRLPPDARSVRLRWNK